MSNDDETAPIKRFKSPKPQEPPKLAVPKAPVGDGTNNIVAVVSGDRFQGPPHMAVLVENTIIYETDVTAENKKSQTQTVRVAAPVSLNGKDVGIRFTNDLYKKGVGDRTLWLHSIRIRGVEMLHGVYKMHSTSTRKFKAPNNPVNVPPPIPPTRLAFSRGYSVSFR